ncbi:MAG: PQQ-dependent sugar dehydrogenase [Saprospiraceae bacterium]|nr:PQQ-dependent sugar dehydrogenase [Saprospiraceae bacterium]
MERLVFSIIIICLSLVSKATDTTVIFRTVINTNLSQPIQITHAGDGTNRVFVAEKGGRIKVFNQYYVLYDTLITLTGLATSGEQGLLSAAFHPNFRNNGYFYVFYTQATTYNLIVDRYTISAGDPDKANVASRLPILNIPHPNNTNHNGGELHFGKDGYLYLSTGDGGLSNDPDDNGQDSLSLLGKILRIDINNTSGGNNYAIPPGNPNPASPVYCYGLRNPFRWSFDRYTGDIYIGDVGQGAREEISYRPATQIAGSNFGWDCYEGTLVHPTSAPCLPISNYVSPFYEYTIVSNNKSVIGGNVYRGYAYADLKGWYIAADYFSQRLRKILKNGNSWVVVQQTMPDNTYTGIADFGETEDGELHMVDLSHNIIYKITAANPKTVYTFTGNGLWTTASNWKEGITPPDPLPAGSVIVIKPYNNGTCTLTENQTINTGADFFVEPGCNFVLDNSKILNID